MASRDTLRRIKSLLEKEGAGGVTPQEAAAAIAKAQALMQREGITQAMLNVEAGTADEEEIKPFVDPLYVARKIDAWRSRLAMALGEANGCEVYYNGNCLMIVGRPSDADALRFIYEYCSIEVVRITDLRAAGEGRTYRNNFRHGCVEAIETAVEREIAAERQSLRQGALSESALVVVNSAIACVDRRYEDSQDWGKKHLGLKNRSGSRARGDSGARAAGLAAGEGIYAGKRRRLG